jgi:hypothetical protein
MLATIATSARAIVSSIVNNVMVDRLCLAIVDLPVAWSVVVRAITLRPAVWWLA